MPRQSNPLLDLIFVLIMAAALGGVWCSSREAASLPVQPVRDVVIRGDSPHLSLRPESYTPRVGEWVLITGKFQGQLGAGNTACLTAAWMVDAKGVWMQGERWCGPPYESFRRKYRFDNPGEFTVTVELRGDSGRALCGAQVILDVQTMAQQDGKE